MRWCTWAQPGRRLTPLKTRRGTNTLPFVESVKVEHWILVKGAGNIARRERKSEREHRVCPSSACEREKSWVKPEIFFSLKLWRDTLRPQQNCRWTIQGLYQGRGWLRDADTSEPRDAMGFGCFQDFKENTAFFRSQWSVSFVRHSRGCGLHADTTEAAEVPWVALQAPRPGRGEESWSWVGWQSISLGALATQFFSGTSRDYEAGRGRMWVRYLEPEGSVFQATKHRCLRGPSIRARAWQRARGVQVFLEMTAATVWSVRTHNRRWGQAPGESLVRSPSWLIRSQRLVLSKLSLCFHFEVSEGSWFSPPPPFLLPPTLRVDSCPWC